VGDLLQRSILQPLYEELPLSRAVAGESDAAAIGRPGGVVTVRRVMGEVFDPAACKILHKNIEAAGPVAGERDLHAVG
jgi:hypothetical protein